MTGICGASILGIFKCTEPERHIGYHVASSSNDPFEIVWSSTEIKYMSEGVKDYVSRVRQHQERGDEDEA